MFGGGVARFFFYRKCEYQDLLKFFSLPADVKKPPLAPKPKLPATAKPCPPPIAPKPGVLLQSSIVSTLKRTKPAVAPKPCIPKSSASSPPVIPPLPKPSDPIILPHQQEDILQESLSILNSKNGFLSETNKWESDYIISTCPGGVEDCSQCPQHLENGNTTEIKAELHKGLLQNGVSAEATETRPQEKAEHQGEKCEGGKLSKKPRDKPQRHRHLAKKEVQENTPETLKHTERATVEPDISNTDTQTEASISPTGCKSARDVVFISPQTSEPLQVEEDSEAISDASAPGLHADHPVPAAPSKPLPVPQPRKLKKPTLVRQDGIEGSAHDQAVREQIQVEVNLAVSVEAEDLERDVCEDTVTAKDSNEGDDDSDAPTPPPRQTSLSPRLQRSAPIPSSYDKSTSYSTALLSQNETAGCDKDEAKHRADEDEEDGYGDFERYPITHSLPKQIKLGCHPPLDGTRKAFSAEDQQSPKAPPRKPQRHSLPAPPPPSICPPAPPHANTPMRELPAPPQEKTAWRFTFFNRQTPTRNSVPPKSRIPALGGKQRAQSFSTADLVSRTDSQKRNLSFRKLLELRVSVKILPKLLAKGGQSLDCTSAESNRGGKSMERPKSCIGEGDIRGEDDVEYENVPLYEEIPEYMNLPFHNARLGWPHDPEAADSDIYEVQDPYHRYQDHEYER